MFCSSLRKRKEWATVPSSLLACQNPKWIEKRIGTHDLSIPLPQQARNQQSKAWFHIVLLSCADMELTQPLMDRIERLCHQAGGQDVGIVFLLTQNSTERSGIASLMQIQALVVPDFDIPIFPLSSLTSLQTTLVTLQRQLVQTRCAPRPVPENPLTALLPFCSTNPPIPEHSRNVMSDVFHSITELAQSAVTPDGRENIKQWLGDGGQNMAEDISEFWATEFIADA